MSISTTMKDGREDGLNAPLDVASRHEPEALLMRKIADLCCTLANYVQWLA